MPMLWNATLVPWHRCCQCSQAVVACNVSECLMKCQPECAALWFVGNCLCDSFLLPILIVIWSALSDMNFLNVFR